MVKHSPIFVRSFVSQSYATYVTYVRTSWRRPTGRIDLSRLAMDVAGAALLLLLLLLFFFFFVFRFVRSFLLAPWSSRRALLSEGFHVLPYRPIAGDLLHLNDRLEPHISPLSPSDHHLLFRRLYPFLHHHLSTRSRGPSDDDHEEEAPLVYWWGTRPTVVITHPEVAKCALSADVKHFHRPESFLIFRPLLGNGLPLLDGPEWLRHRNIMRPAFFADRLKDMVGHMTICAMEIIGEWEKQLQAAAAGGGGCVEIEVAKPIKNITADILSRTLFGINYLHGKEIFEMQDELHELLARLGARNSVFPGHRYLPSRDNRRVKELEEKISVKLRMLVESRQQQRVQEEDQRVLLQTPTRGAPDLLGLIVGAEEAEEAKSSSSLSSSLGSSDRDSGTQRIIDECKSFFFAGHETTASLLAWTMLLLSLHEEWQERARREVLGLCGGGGGDIDSLQSDALNRMKIMGMILNETLRLYPPAPELGRRVMNPADHDFKLGSRTLPRGTGIVVECLYIHRRKDIWGEDADEFKPERFADGLGNACKHPYGFIPFGIGPRNCLGQNFAMVEAKVILAHILTHFKFRLSPTYVHAPVVAITMRPQHGLHLILEPL